MKIYQTSKTVLRVQPRAVPFLNSLTANIMTAPRNAFLNVHGRIIATFDQLVLNPDEVWIVLENDFVKLALEHLDRYAKLSQVQLESLNKKVYFDLVGDYALQPHEYAIPQVAGQLIITEQVLSATIDEPSFVAFRLQHGLPQLGVDYRDEFLLNVSETEFVSYTKGCFLGQEPVAKVHHRSKPTWRLIVKNEKDCTPEEQLKMTSCQNGQGFVFIANS